MHSILSSKIVHPKFLWLPQQNCHNLLSPFMPSYIECRLIGDSQLSYWFLAVECFLKKYLVSDFRQQPTNSIEANMWLIKYVEELPHRGSKRAEPKPTMCTEYQARSCHIRLGTPIWTTYILSTLLDHSPMACRHARVHIALTCMRKSFLTGEQTGCNKAHHVYAMSSKRAPCSCDAHPPCCHAPMQRDRSSTVNII